MSVMPGRYRKQRKLETVRFLTNDLVFKQFPNEILHINVKLIIKLFQTLK